MQICECVRAQRKEIERRKEIHVNCVRKFKKSKTRQFQIKWMRKPFFSSVLFCSLFEWWDCVRVCVCVANVFIPRCFCSFVRSLAWMVDRSKVTKTCAFIMILVYEKDYCWCSRSACVLLSSFLISDLLFSLSDYPRSRRITFMSVFFFGMHKIETNEEKK